MIMSTNTPSPSPLPAEIDSLPIQHPHAAGIDVGDRIHWVCIGQHVREFPAHTAGLRDLVKWLRQHHITTVAMEASGCYGHVLYLTLLEAKLDTIMTSPAFTRQIQGRPKTDRLDCQWIFRLHTHGLLPPVFQPDDSTQTLRAYVRQRGNLVRLSGQYVQRMQKSLELMNLKLTHVVGDITGVTGLKIIRAILGGERDAKVLAGLRDRRCKHTREEIATALEGRYRPEHLSELRSSVVMWEKHLEVIAELDTEIEKHLQVMRRTSELPPLSVKPRVRGKKPHDPKFHVRSALYYITGIDITLIEGIDEIHALTLISELGTDMTKWPTVKHFTSWLGLCPQFKKTGGKVKSSKTRRGPNRAARAFRLAAWGLMRSKSYLGAFLRRKRAHLGAPKAITATAHKLARIFYTIMRYGIEYQKRDEAAYAAEVKTKMEQNLHRRAKELGYELRKIESPESSESSETSQAEGSSLE
jgi:transposase